MQRRREYRTVADSAKGEPGVVTDGQSNRGLHGNGRPPAPSAGASVDLVAMPKNVHRENAVLVEAPELTQLDDGMVAHASDFAEVLRELREADVAQVLAVARIALSRGEIDPHEMVEDQRLG